MNKSSILKRIQKEYNLEKNSDFAAFLEKKPQTISSWHSRNTFDHDLLYEKLPDLNPDFLFSGKGNVRIKINTHFVSKVTEAEYLKPHDLTTDGKIQDQSVPLYDIEAMAGVVPLLTGVEDQTPIDYITIPNIPKCDGAVYVVGDSMYPLLKSGDIIMYKTITDFKNDVYWGEMYLISIDVAEEDFTMVKFLQKSEKGDNYIKLVSQNRHHQDKDVLISKVRALALIKASIRINSMN